MSLLNDLPDATFLVTSRARLRVRGERVFDVEPLALPPDPARASVEAISTAPAVRLFRDRARAADPRFELTAENADGRRPHLPGARGRAARDRARRGPHPCPHARRDAARGSTGCSRCSSRRPATSPSASAPSRRPSSGASTCSAPTRGPCSCASACSPGTSASTPSRPSRRARRGPPTCSARSSSSSTAASCASTTTPACRSSRCSCRCARSRPPASTSSRMPRPCAARTASTTCDSPPRSSRCCRGRRSPTRCERLEAERDNLRAAFRHLISDRRGRRGRRRGLAPASSTGGSAASSPRRRPGWRTSSTPACRCATTRGRSRSAFSSWVSLSQPGTEVDLGPIEWSLALFHAVGDRLGEAWRLTALSIACTTRRPPDLERAEGLQRRALELVAADDQPTFDGALPRRARAASALLQRRRRRRGRRSSRGSSRTPGAQGDVFVESITLANSGGRGWRAARRAPTCSRAPRAVAAARATTTASAFALEGTGGLRGGLAGDVERAGDAPRCGARPCACGRGWWTSAPTSPTGRSSSGILAASDRAAADGSRRARGRGQADVPRRRSPLADLGAGLGCRAASRWRCRP